MKCELCENDGGVLIWRNERCRVVRVDDPHFPNPVWSPAIRQPGPRAQAAADFDKALAERLSRL